MQSAGRNGGSPWLLLERFRIKVRDIDVEALQVVAIFSGLGLLLSLMFLTYGIDLSPGFF